MESLPLIGRTRTQGKSAAVKNEALHVGGIAKKSQVERGAVVVDVNQFGF